MYHAIREEILCREERYVICDVLRKEEMEKNEVKKSGRGESAQIYYSSETLVLLVTVKRIREHLFYPRMWGVTGCLRDGFR